MGDWLADGILNYIIFSDNSLVINTVKESIVVAINLLSLLTATLKFP